MTIRHQMGGEGPSRRGGGQTTGGYKGRTQEVTEGVYGGGEDHGRNLDRKGKGI